MATSLFLLATIVASCERKPSGSSADEVSATVVETATKASTESEEILLVVLESERTMGERPEEVSVYDSTGLLEAKTLEHDGRTIRVRAHSPSIASEWRVILTFAIIQGRALVEVMRPMEPMLYEVEKRSGSWEVDRIYSLPIHRPAPAAVQADAEDPVMAAALADAHQFRRDFFERHTAHVAAKRDASKRRLKELEETLAVTTHPDVRARFEPEYRRLPAEIEEATDELRWLGIWQAIIQDLPRSPSEEP